jgi:sec-independent protein translocase protein TatA
MPNTFLELPTMFPGPLQLLVVLFIILLLFGGAKVPSLMRNLGRGASEFKKGLSDAEDGGEDKALEDKRS